jgi:uncharacterized protein (TIGR02722 family)
MNTKHVVHTSVLAVALLGFAGCNEPARRIPETESITTVGNIDIQDWNLAATELSKSLINSGVLDNAPRKPAVLAMSRIVNNTTQQVDIDLLTKSIRETLLGTGKVVTTTTFGSDSNVEDPMARDIQHSRATAEGRQPGVADLPDYTLSGKLIELRSEADRVHQATFSFQLSLTDSRTGYAVWEKQKQITKQGTKSSVGF